MKMKNVFNTVVMIMVIIFAVIKSGAIEKITVSSATPQEAQTLVKENKAIIVDVRESDEVKEGMVEGALWIPKSGFDSKDTKILDQISKLDKSKEVLLYCRSGNRAGKVGAELQKQGFKVKNIGGFETLKSSGFNIKNQN